MKLSVLLTAWGPTIGHACHHRTHVLSSKIKILMFLLCELQVAHVLLGVLRLASAAEESYGCQQQQEIFDAAEGDENSESLLADVCISSDDFPNGESTIEEPQHGKSRGRHHLRHVGTSQLAPELHAPNVNDGESHDGSRSEDHNTKYKIPALDDEGSIRVGSSIFAMLGQPFWRSTSNAPINGRHRPREPNAEEDIHRVASGHIHNGSIGIVVLNGCGTRGEEIGHRCA
mmetsp:Transcript_47507/g.102373  ORF Transcript_47507/g.102373 Transcript_47507/m.102373 type:complete len:230 (-) Transcript_47507:1076-1765(-)